MAENTPRWTSAVKLLSLLAFGVLSAPLVVPAAEPVDAETAKIITQMIPSFHVSRKGVDDRISSMLLDSYLKDLDPAKLYFLQSDIDEFAPHRLTLDDELKAGNVQFGYDVFNRYKERMAIQLKKAHELIDAHHDFTVDESLIIKGDDQPWARTQEEVDDRWRRPRKKVENVCIAVIAQCSGTLSR